MLVLHAGGNDLEVRSSRELEQEVKLDLLKLWASHPGLIVVWSDMVARRVCRHARSVQGINRAPAKANKVLERLLLGTVDWWSGTGN